MKPGVSRARLCYCALRSLTDNKAASAPERCAVSSEQGGLRGCAAQHAPGPREAPRAPRGRSGPGLRAGPPFPGNFPFPVALCVTSVRSTPSNGGPGPLWRRMRSAGGAQRAPWRRGGPRWRPCRRTTCGSSCGGTRPAGPCAPRHRRGTARREYRPWAAGRGGRCGRGLTGARLVAGALPSRRRRGASPPRC